MKEYTQPEKLGRHIIEQCLDSHKVTNSLLISIDILSRLNNIGWEISKPTPNAAEDVGRIECSATLHPLDATALCAPVPSPDGAGEKNSLRKRAVEFITRNDPFGDEFTERDLWLLDGAAEPDALGYATRLLTTFVQEHFPTIPDWKPLPDLIGVLTQIDNAITIARDYKSRLATPPIRGDQPIDLDAWRPFANFINDPLFPQIPDEEILTAGSALTRSYITYGELRALCKAIPLLPNRETFYSILTKFIPQEVIDEAWQELKEARLVP